MRKKHALLLLLPALLVLLALVLAGCKDFSFYGVLGDRIDDTPLQIAPAAASVAVGATLDFTAAGGKAPYIFLVAGGPGSFSDADTFLASAAGTVQVQVTDSKGHTSIATVSVTSTGSPLAISPTDVSMGPGGQVQFVASGGTGSPPSYFFTLAASSESGATLSAAGDYQAGPNLGQDTIELTDGVSMVTAQVDVTAAVTNVEYVLSASIIPAAGTGGDDFTYSFTIQNTGSGNGTQPISWWMYISDDGSLGSGDTLLGNGNAGYLASLDSAPITTQSGTWPRSSGSKTLFVMIAAEDDLTVYTSGGIPVLLSPPDIDYKLSGLSPGSTTTTGGALSGTFDLINSGSSDGKQPVSWTVYVSTDDTWQATDPVVDAGSVAALDNGLGHSGIAFDGTWPPAADDYYLIVRVFASDEPSPADAADNELISPNPGITVSRPTVNYAVGSFTYSGTAPFAPATAVSGSFHYSNASSMDNGTQWVNWTVYASLDATIDPSDIVVASGSLPPLTSGQTSGLIPFNGLWPLVFGNYSLILQAGSPWELETDTADNRVISAAASVGIYNAIVQNGNCVNLTNYTDLVGVVLKPGMSLKVISAGYPPAHLDHLFRLNTGTANTVTASWVLDNTAATEDIGIFFYRGPPGVFFGGGYWITGRASVTLTFAVDAPSVMRWIDLYSDKNKDLGSYVLYITAN